MSNDNLSGLLVRGHSETKLFKYLRISSLEGTNLTPTIPPVLNPCSFNISFGSDPRLDHVYEAHVTAVSFPNMFYNISESVGNNIYTGSGSTTGLFSFTIADGFYDVSSLIPVLQTAMNSALSGSGTTIVITQNPLTYKFIFTSAGPETITYFGSDSGNKMGTTLGLVGTTVGSPITATNPVNLAGERVVYLHSVDVGPNITYTGTSTGYTEDVNGYLMIPITVPYGVTQGYIGTGNDRIIYGSSGKPLKNSLSFNLRGSGGRILVLPSNVEVVITLKIFYLP